MSPGFRRRFRRQNNGLVTVSLPKEEREALSEFLRQMREMLINNSDPSLRRLKPPAQPDDPRAESDFRNMIDDDLLRNRLKAIDTVTTGIDGTDLDSEGVAAWMQALNCLRLILGERFEADGIDPDSGRSDSPMVDIYQWLAWLMEQLVEAAMPSLDN